MRGAWRKDKGLWLSSVPSASSGTSSSTLVVELVETTVYPGKLTQPC